MEHVMHLRKNMRTYVNLGQMPEFMKLRKEASIFGLGVCSCLVCKHPVKDAREFDKSIRNEKRGLKSSCKECEKNGHTKKSQMQKQKHQEQNRANVDSIEACRSGGEIEDEVMHTFLVPALSMFVTEVMPEFRLCDLLVKYEIMQNYIQIQLKTDGILHRNGKLKPDNSTHKKDDAGRAMYYHVSRYNGMLVIFVKTREVDGVLIRYIWVANGSEITKETIHENADGTLGPQKIPQVTVEGMITAIHDTIQEEQYHVSFEDTWMNVPNKDHFKEVCCIQALQTVYNVVVPRQNQQIFDCLFDKRRVQVKLHSVKAENARLCKRKNGSKRRQPYDSTDPIDVFCFVCIIKCLVKIEDTTKEWYFMLYCEIGMDELIKNKMVRHKSDNHEESVGKICLCTYAGIYEKMLLGKTKKPNKETEWLKKYPIKHVRLHEHTDENPQVHKLTKEHLQTVAQAVKDTQAMPSCMF